MTRSPRQPDTVRTLIDRQAATHGDAPFLVIAGEDAALTFAGLRARTREIAAALCRLGLAPGDRVALLVDNGRFLVEVLLGIQYGGFVALPLSPQAGPGHIAHALERATPRVVLVTAPHQALLDTARPATVRVLEAEPDQGLSWPAEGDDPAALPAIDPHATAVLAFTSGTTGQPKGVVFSHRSAVAGARNVAAAHRLTPADRSLVVLPLSHQGPRVSSLMAPLVSGGSLVLARRFETAGFWDAMIRYRCTWSSLVPTHVRQLVTQAEPPDPAALAHVRFIRTSAAPLPPTLHREFETRFAIPLLECMGASEAGSNIFSTPLPPRTRKPGSPGISSGLEVRVADSQGRPLPTGQAGRILVRGPSVMTGYFEDPAATAAVLDGDGWLDTGDVGYLDDEGYAFVVGRTQEFVKKGGIKIALREIEQALERHPAVLDAAAVGVPDRYLGEDIVAAVVLRPGVVATASELLAFCERGLGSFKVPTGLELVDEIPRTPSGKVARHLELGRPEIADSEDGAFVSSPGGSGGDGRQGPRTPVEQIVAETWREALGRSPIGVHENFFALGGGSLAIVQALARLHGRLPVPLSFGAFVEHPTIAEQALLIDQLLLRALDGTDTALRLLDELEALPPDGAGENR